MFANYFKIAWRTLWKERLFSGLNLVGLAMGLTVSSLLFLYVQEELSFDRYHENAERTYRVIVTPTFEGVEGKWANAPNIVGPIAKEKIAGVEAFVRLLKHNFGSTAFVNSEELKFVEKYLYWADPGLFEIFDIDLISGDPKTALEGPNKVILSRTIAEKYFPEERPLGKVLKIDGNQSLEVTGVYEDFPTNSSLDAELIGSFQSQKWATERLYWSNSSFETYLLLNEQTDANTVDQKLAAILDENVPEEEQWFSMSLQALPDIHLYSDDITNSYTSRLGDPQQVRILSLLALVIILIAGINYMNLTTARAQQRFKEVGIKKTVGASRGQLAGRFYLETGILVFGALVLSIGLMQISLPLFNNLADKQFIGRDILDPQIIAAILGIALLVVLISGAYPAIYLSSVKPKQLLQTSFRKETGAGFFRQTLVVIQLAASLVLIISTLVFFRQLRYVQDKKLGFEPEQVVAITTAGAEKGEQIDALINGLQSLPEVVAVCRAQTFPGSEGSGHSIAKPDDPNRSMLIQSNRVSPEFIDVLELEVLAGKSLPTYAKSEDDTVSQVVLNRTAVEFMGYTPEEAIGRPATSLFGEGRSQIVGVVEDFHFQTFREAIGGYAFHNRTSTRQRFALAKLETDQLLETMKKIEGVFHERIPNSAFEFTFVDQHLDNLYRAERRTARVFMAFSFLAIFVACLGLFGLATFTAERRTKEIGVRKVLGATVTNILGLLSKEFLVLLLIAMVLAAPVAWWLMNQWLQDFAYHINLEWWVFLVAGLGLLVIALITISFQSLRAALANPVESLRYE